MRDIKYRAWDKKDKVVRDVVGMSFYHESVSVDIEYGRYLQDDIKRFELMQYTGLKDKNGAEIYEGDILSSEESSMVKTLRNWGIGETEIEEKWKHEELWVVEYRKGYFQIISPQKRNKDKLGYVLAHNISSEPEDLEVIGNIYENTELLETIVWR